MKIKTCLVGLLLMGSAACRNWERSGSISDGPDASGAEAEVDRQGDSAESDGPSEGSSSKPAGAEGTVLHDAGQWAAFPSTAVLDDFERAADLGESWDASYVFVSQYALEAGELRCTDCSFYEPLLWVESFGTEQEVFAKLTGFGAVGKEISLVLLAQGGACNHVQLIYSPQWQYLSVDICDENNPNFGNVWMLGRTLNVGDQLGARVLQPGNRIEVFVNGQRIDTVDVSEFLFTSGSIGLIGFSDANVTLSWDDFGGGNYE